jgi:transglutaminase-like putative cysteine protease
MNYTIKQTTQYNYDGPVKHSINQCILKPLNDQEQQCLSYTFTVEPEAEVFDYIDYWGNTVETFYMKEPHHDLKITTQALVSVNRSFPNGQLQLYKTDSEVYQMKYAEYLRKTPFTDISDSDLDQITLNMWQDAADMLDYANKVNAYIYETYSYESGSTNVESTAQDMVRDKKGVCQDFTHLMLSMCRYRGVAARYVSGFVYCGQNSAMRGDAAMHAWVEVALPGIGWVGLDPTNKVYALNQHIRVAVGRDYKDIIPVKGVYMGGKQTMNVHASVSLLKE